MLTFYFGIGAAALITATFTNTWQLAAAHSLLGLFASIYRPVGIPMLLQNTKNAGATIGLSGFSGNSGGCWPRYAAGFQSLWIAMAAIALLTLVAIFCLPDETSSRL